MKTSIGRHDPFADYRIRILVVVSRFKGMKATTTFLAQRQFAQLGRGAVGDDLALDDLLGKSPTSRPRGRWLIAGVLVRALELAHPVDVDAGVADLEIGGGADDDTFGIDLVDHAGDVSP